MNKFLSTVVLSALTLGAFAQDADIKADTTEGFLFTTIDSVAITPVKDQHRSSTCWSFSTIGFIESELLRMGKGEFDLSEMFVVQPTYKIAKG